MTGAAGATGDLDEGSKPVVDGEHAEGPPGDGAAPASGSQLLRSSAVVAVGTGLSRVTGLARTIAQGVVLGRFIGDVYNAANTLPNLLYDLLLGGVLAATLVPVFVETRTRRDAEATGAVLTTLGVALVAATAAALAFSPVLGRVFTNTDQEAELATVLLLLFLPQIFFYGMTTLASGLLNAHRRFAAAAFVPVLNNIVTIVVLVVFSARIGSSPTLDDLSSDSSLLWLLGVGTTAGIAVQALALVPAVRRARIPIRWRFDPRNPAVRSVVRLSGWTFGYVATNAVVIGIVIALAGNETEQGPVTAYTYAYQFFQLPYGLLAVAVITAFLPELSQLALDGEMQAFGDRFLLALRLTVLLVVPAAIGFVLLALPMIATVFEYRAFDHELTLQTSDTLLAFSVGLPSFALYLLSIRAFYAMKDTKTPFLVNLAQSALLLVLATALRKGGAAGLALGFALAYVVFGFVALAVLHRRTGGLPWAGSLGSFTRIGLAAIVCAVAVGLVSRFVGTDAGGGAWVRTITGVLVGGGVYLGVCVALRVPELRQATSLLRRSG
ncbi:MAG: murein biosynthesis integral membrane protein MurJ [Actinobacteria bacterium]|nr:murein biosynthesis integral membrane protein MurJ [Actinomycetota bacterium]